MGENPGSTDSQFMDKTFEGVQEAVNTWASNQKDALDNVATDLPALSAYPPFVKAAAWMSMGIASVRTFFPHSALVACLDSIAIPVAMVGFTVDFFQSRYNNYVDRLNAMMAGQYLAIMDVLKDAVDQAKIKFLDKDFNGFGSYVLATTRDVLKKRQPYLNEGGLRSHVIAVLTEEQYGIIEIGNKVIRERTCNGFAALAEKTFKLYQGTDLAWGTNEIRHLYYDTTHDMDHHFLTAFNCPYDPKLGRRSCQDVPLAVIHPQHVVSSDFFAWFLDNLWKLEVEMEPGIDAFFGNDRVYVYASDNPDTRLEDMVTNIRKGVYPDLRARIVAADEKLWARRRAF